MFVLNDFPTGNCIFYHNLFVELDNREIKKQFKLLTNAEIAALKTGDIVWCAIEKKHPVKNARGFIKRRITKIVRYGRSGRIIKIDNFRIQMMLGSGKLLPTFFRIKDEARLTEMINANRLATLQLTSLFDAIGYATGHR